MKTFFFRLYEGLDLPKQLPEFFRLYQMAKAQHANGYWLDYMTYETPGIGFQDGIDVEYVSYDPARRRLTVSASTSLQRRADFIDELIEVQSKDGLLGSIRKSTSAASCTTLIGEFDFNAEKHSGEQLCIHYTSVWSDPHCSQLKALTLPFTIDVDTYLNSCIKSITMEFPRNIHTSSGSSVVVCYGRTPSIDLVDRIYPLNYKAEGTTLRPCLLLDCTGNVAFDEPESQAFSTIDINSFELKINGNSGYALYRLSYDNGGVIDRTQEIIKSFRPTSRGFCFNLDKDWKDFIPTLSLPVEEIVKLTLRVEFKLKNGMRSVLQIASGVNEKVSNVWKIPALKLLWGCLAKGSLILMADGSQKPIEQIRIGESVRVNYTNMTARVTNCWCGQETQPLILAETADNRQIKATANHPVITSAGIVPAGELKVGDWLIDASGEPCKIQRIAHIHVDEVYNLSIEQKPEAQIYTDGCPVNGMTMICDGFMVGDNEMQNFRMPVRAGALTPLHIYESQIKQAFFERHALN